MVPAREMIMTDNINMTLTTSDASDLLKHGGAVHHHLLVLHSDRVEVVVVRLTIPLYQAKVVTRRDKC